MKKQFIEAGKKLGLTGLALAAYVQNALAAVPVAVTDAITGAGTDAGVIGAAVLVVVVGLLAYKYMRGQAK